MLSDDRCEGGTMTIALFDDVPADPTGAPVPERVVTFVHTADWQLGMTRHFLPRDAQELFTAARLAAVERIGVVAADVGAEFVVVCGDVFEDHRVSARIVRQALDRMAGFTVPVYLMPGNHDPFDAASIYRSEAFVRGCPGNVTVLSTPGVREVADGVDLVVAPWPTKSPTNDLVAEQVARLRAGDRIRIVAGHGGTDRLSPGSDPAILAVDPLEAAVRDEIIDFVALGDRHSVTDLGSTGRIWYSGAHETTNFDDVECRPGEVLAVTLTRGTQRTATVTAHPVGRWRFHSMTADVDSAADVDALAARLEAIPAKPTTVVRLGLVGSLSVGDHAGLTDLLDESSDRFAALVRWDSHDDLRVVADPADIAGLGLRGYAAEAADELVALAGSGDADAAVARDALALLGRLAGGGDR